MWNFPNATDALDDNGVNFCKRQSVCELEGDVAVEDILNQHSKLYTSFSQTYSDVKMVQSLVSIWEEEYRRTGLQEAPVPPDPGKPLPKEVLEAFSLGVDYEKKLTELYERPKSPSVLTPLEEDERLVQSLTSSANEADITGVGCSDGKPLKHVKEISRTNSDSFCPSSFEDYDKMLIEGEDVVPRLSMDEVQVTPKAVDEEALGLLRWLATSQAAQDINSDDELLCETILGPLLPAANMDQVLERASQDYGSESQKECQDILDSVEDLEEFEGFNKRKCCPDDEHLHRSSSEETIPQLDGASDDVFSSCGGSTENSADRDLNFENEKSSKLAALHGIDSGSCSHKKEKSLWGSLPFHETEKLNTDSTCVNSCRPDICASLTKDSEFISYFSRDDGRQMDVTLQNAGAGAGTYNSREGYVFVERSVRDLMRRKRHYRNEPLDCGYGKVKNFTVDSRQRKVWSRDLDSQVFQSNEHSLRFRDSSHLMPCLTNQNSSSDVFYENKSAYSNSSMYGKLPLVDGCDGLVQASSPNVGEIPGSEIVTGPSQVCSYVWLSESETLGVGPVSLGGCEILASKESNSGASDANAHESTPSIQCADEDYLAPSTKRRFLLVNQYSNDRKQKEDSVLSGLGHSVSMVADFHGEQTLSIGLTTRRKPPNADLIHKEHLNVSTSSIMPWKLAPLDQKDVEGRTGRALDDLLPFFLHRDKKDIFEDYGYSSPQEAAMGVPIHYRNDGSFMYILTPVNSPPSTDSVSQWLTSEQGALGISSGKPLVDDPNKSLPQLASSSHTSHIVNHGGLPNSTADETSFPENLEPVRSGGITAEVRACASSSQDISQISGPDGISKATPLSQIGFCDPASAGGMQQLTLLSVEVQAECRGDLRPDPRLDAVKMIALAIQTDSGPIVEVVLIFCTNIDSSKRNRDGIGYNVLVHHEEKSLFRSFMKIIYLTDPDILIGWDIQGSSLGFLAERASQLGINLLNKISRTPDEAKMLDGNSNTQTEIPGILVSELVNSDSAVVEDVVEDMIVEDEWGRTHASGIHIGGRIVLNLWRLMRNEVKLNIYTLEAVAEAVLRRKLPYIHHRVLTQWFNSGPRQARFRCIEYVTERAKLNLQLLMTLDMINRTSELARVFGIEFFSVLSRGSQYRVESMLLRLAHSQNYLAVSPGNLQVASQPAMECLPLVMEPESGFYADPVVVLDFQSLYPSMIIAYNLCFCTCLGKVAPSKVNTLGVISYSPERQVLDELKDQILFTPNGVMYVPPKVRKGILPRLLEEILLTRIMVKQGMKKLASSQKVLQRVFNARQLALKLIANVTYGYTAAGFSGRMPCAELADSIVQCGRRTLESAISFVNSQEKWKAKVIYGDTDSMFVLLKGHTVEQAFGIGQEIASAVSAMNPNPVTLKMEKVYAPCFLLTKKRYVGYSFESPEQIEPTFDAKGIETVRRDTCAAVAKTMEQSLRLFFEHQDISEIKTYLQRQWKRILSGRVSIQDFVFAKEVRLGTYRTRGPSSLPPAAIVATKAMRIDPRAEPRYAERIPYVVIYREPGARLADMVVDPMDLLAVDSPHRLNSLYYINKQIIPALQRAFGLVGANLNQWFLEMPRPVREVFFKQPLSTANPNRTRIDYYYLSKHCILCGELVQTSSNLCNQCLQNEAAATTAIIIKTSKLESEMQHLAAICRHCGGADGIVECGVKCISLACSVFYERLKVQKELRGLVAVAAHKDLYPKWTVEWF
ncbi:DNA polymerase zeta catalytic subunit isoform X2 [Benincasa hispida]|nr:DNA polymerase zeta catalytic subunit isoform X2 [Benincasa hispida]